MARKQKITQYQVDHWKNALEQMLEEGNFRQDSASVGPAQERKKHPTAGGAVLAQPAQLHRQFRC
ncbi:hypothetical protein AB0D34_08550 [Streptomyces sp. NPDC048420]|uniref:hypothetical protein n=1 Tax=Streptomyces sp. NPDC048420 TaxID=3155755 RepID=UPI00344AF749